MSFPSSFIFYGYPLSCLLILIFSYCNIISTFLPLSSRFIVCLHSPLLPHVCLYLPLGLVTSLSALCPPREPCMQERDRDPSNSRREMPDKHGISLTPQLAFNYTTAEPRYPDVHRKSPNLESAFSLCLSLVFAHAPM